MVNYNRNLRNWNELFATTLQEEVGLFHWHFEPGIALTDLFIEIYIPPASTQQFTKIKGYVGSYEYWQGTNVHNPISGITISQCDASTKKSRWYNIYISKTNMNSDGEFYLHYVVDERITQYEGYTTKQYYDDMNSTSYMFNPSYHTAWSSLGNNLNDFRFEYIPIGGVKTLLPIGTKVTIYGNVKI